MIDICIVYISKNGGFPYNGGGFHSLIFDRIDIHFIAKILDDLDMSDDTYRYAITTTIKHSEKKYISHEDREILLKTIFKELKKKLLTKKLVMDDTYIYINQNKGA